MATEDASDLFRAGLEHHQAGRLQEAEAMYRRALAQDPAHGDALHHLGIIAIQVGQHAAAVELMQQALAVIPTEPELLANLGEACRQMGRRQEAADLFVRALQIAPEHATAHNNLGALLVSERRVAEAVPHFRAALERKPDHYPALLNLASALSSLEDFPGAISCLRRAAALRPGETSVWIDLGIACTYANRFDEAAAAYETALHHDPKRVEARCGLGFVRFHQGRVEEAVERLQQAFKFGRLSAADHSAMMMALNCHPDVGPAELADELVRWRERHADPLAPFDSFPNDCDARRRLRIGYVSPDFRGHPVGFNLLPLFEQHSRSAVEIFVYSDVRQQDVVTELFKQQAGTWCDVSKMTDDQLVGRLRADRIDILVDLALHSPRNRLTVFARRPAPVQVTFAGYPGSTGLRTIDYRLSDPWLDPEGMFDRYYSETTWRLPHSFWCFAPFDEQEVNAPPFSASGHITFGSLNTFGKVNSRVIAAWGRVLAGVPHSRMLILASPGSARAATLQLFAQAGVAAERITFADRCSRRDYFRLYHQIDIGLDTFPYNGHTTSLDSLWMGVPVVTLVGQRVVGRAGLSQLSNLGLTELVAGDPDQFVRIATQLAFDRPRLAELRRTLRLRMQGSPLTDAPRFARDIEDAYRTMWRRWCEGASAA